MNVKDIRYLRSGTALYQGEIVLTLNCTPQRWVTRPYKVGISGMIRKPGKAPRPYREMHHEETFARSWERTPPVPPRSLRITRPGKLNPRTTDGTTPTVTGQVLTWRGYEFLLHRGVDIKDWTVSCMITGCRVIGFYPNWWDAIHVAKKFLFENWDRYLEAMQKTRQDQDKPTYKEDK